MKPLINIDYPEIFFFYQTTFYYNKNQKNLSNQKKHL